jgi:hypothetical protein
MRIHFKILFVLLILAMVSCSHKMNIAKLRLDKQNNFYTYKFRGSNFAVRNPNNTLVTPNNLKNFLITLDSCEYKYIIDQVLENDYYISSNDATLVNLYSGIVTSLNIKNPDAAFYFLNEFKKNMPEFYKYTDIDFLEGRAWELKHNNDSAKFYYNLFLQYSSSKYSSLFRGYTYNDSVKAEFTRERQFAASFQDNKANFSEIKLEPIFPKYYYQSFNPGYVVNREDIGFNNLVLPGFSLMGSTTEITYWGLNATVIFNEKNVLYLAVSSSDFQRDYLISAPYQLFKTKNNRFGIKITPMLYMNTFRKTDINELTGSFINAGAGISVGYQLTHNFSAGISYLGFFYNQYYKHKVENTNNEIYLNNEFEMSIFYQLMKSINAKIGISNGNLVAGLVFTGSFLGYDSQNRGISYKFSVH